MSRFFELVPKDVKAMALLKVRMVARNSPEKKVPPLKDFVIHQGKLNDRRFDS